METDVLIVGGGMIGLTLALALARAGIRSVVVDRAAPAPDPARATAPAFDGRATAIAYASYQMFGEIGVWDKFAAHAEAINEIRVSDGRLHARSSNRAKSRAPASWFLHFDHRALGDGPLGFMVENRHILSGLWTTAGARPEITLCAPARLENLDRSSDWVTAELYYSGTKTKGPTQMTVRSQLVVGADGRSSIVRTSAGIKCASGGYGQTAIVATVTHDSAHGGIAEECFLPAGPFAILPLIDTEDGDHRSSLVWTETKTAAQTLLGLNNPSFTSHLAERFGDHLGEISVTGPRWDYPLGYQQAERYTDRRLVLAGDAAHVIHPIAGQGANLGFRDVAALAEVLVGGFRLGMDLGSPPLLARYQRWRRFDGMVLLGVTDSLNRLFSNDRTPVRWARDLGLAAVNHAPGLKSFFMRHARGTIGHLPRLLKGEPL